MTINRVNNLCANFTADAITADSITFDSGTNTLSSYTTNTWTPALAFGGATTGITYTTQSGEYYKIGNIVFISGYVLLSSKGTATGATTITGLPFSITNIGLSDNNLSCVNVSHRLTGTQFNTQVATGSVLSVVYSGGSGRSTVLDTQCTNTSSFRFTLFYFTS